MEVYDTTLIALATMTVLGALFSLLLVVANRKLAVEIDPREARLISVLPGANCGGCGFASCASYARSIVRDRNDVTRCSVGGPAVAERIAGLMGVTLAAMFPYRPVIHCAATEDQRMIHGDYQGEPTCWAAHVTGGVQGCTYGCLGLGDCVTSCEYDAMIMMNGLPRIDYEKCVGCGACVRTCPRQIIEQIPFKAERMMVVGCANHDPAKAVRAVCKVGCIGCSLCARTEPELFSIQDNLAVIDYDRATGTEDLEKVHSKCPMESLIYIGKPVDEPEAMEQDTVHVGRPEPVEHELDWRG